MKTLDDFMTDCGCCIVGSFGKEISNLKIDAWEVRQESIKWYKYYKDKMDEPGMALKDSYYHKMEFIKEFFNLTEEDINDQEKS